MLIPSKITGSVIPGWGMSGDMSLQPDINIPTRMMLRWVRILGCAIEPPKNTKMVNYTSPWIQKTSDVPGY
jgi:hypothetical protein